MAMDDPLDTFIVESRDLLAQMEQALLEAEHGTDDPDLINAIFRAAHTIKGTAGLFGLDHIVAFTHVAESVLDRVRERTLPLDEALVALFLDVCDHLGSLVERVARREPPDDASAAAGLSLCQGLSAYLGATAGTPAGPPATREAAVERSGGGAVETDLWHLSLRFGPDVLRNGMDPIAFVRYLGTLGKIAHLIPHIDAVPPLAELDAESCHLGLDLSLNSDADKATLDGAFDFVREDSHIRILAPNSRIEDYLALIQELPDEEMRLGEILVACGTLTQAELTQVLALQQGTASTPAPIGQMVVDEGMVHETVVEAALDRQKSQKEARATDAAMIRVEAAKLDQLINLVGELIIAGAGAHNVALRLGNTRLLEATATLSRLVEEVRDSALTLRMVQIGATFNRFRRVVRDVAKELGKEIRLEISGGETELDKTVVEKIGDPLTHIVRNAIDHGIEPADVRRARGKPAEGTLRLNAYHESGSIVIEVSDDGGGLNRERILKKALERGLVAEGHNLTDREIHNLVFEAGFSTAEQITNLSGRGVGMDVVKRNIEAARGTVELDSVEGVGTTLSIRLPLTLAIIDGFLIGVGKASYVVPLDLVEECIELPRQREQKGDYLNLRGEVLPFVRLRDLFETTEPPPRRENVVVVRYAGRRTGLVVDQLMGEFQTVIKPLGKVFRQLRAIGGSTILGSGEVALILDVPSLLQEVMSRELRGMETTVPERLPALPECK